MRAGLSTIQQTLTPEASSVLNHSIAEAARRNHGQTTPLHVASTLLASPSGYLRQACIRSHPNSSHPLQCRALELCFSVALDRLPSAAAPPSNAASAAEPPISNALMAALKRAQAHQRRGCPEQQQQPLLAVKVELEQLIVSILDDPSVSRVMREASFSSPAIKATIEQSIATTSSSSAVSSPPNATTAANSPSLGVTGGFGGLGGLRPTTTTTTTLLPGNRNLYLNPRLQQHHLQQQQQELGNGGAQPRREEEVKKVLDILMRTNKRNPVLVGDSEPEDLMKEVFERVEKETGDGHLKNAHIISLEKEFASDRSQIPEKLMELGNSIEARLEIYSGVILNLGDLKWLVESPSGHGEQQHQQLVPEVGRTAVAEMGKVLKRFGEGGGAGSRVWLIGTASCATYLRCQVYHPSMENDWDLQAVPITPRVPVPGMFHRSGGNGILSSSVESLAPHRGFPAVGAAAAATVLSRHPSKNTDPSLKTMCPSCTGNYEQELAKLVAGEFEKSTPNSKQEAQQSLPPWLQAANLSNGSAKSTSEQLQTGEQELKWKQKTEELLKRWKETCAHLHCSFHHPATGLNRPPLGSVISISNSFNSNMVNRQPFQPKPSPVQGSSPIQLSNHRSKLTLNAFKLAISPPGSPVRTDLVLGRSNSTESTALEQNHKDRVKDSGGCVQDFLLNQQRVKVGSNLDADSFKRLFKGLTEKIGWQPEAASAVAVTVTRCRSGNGKRRATGTKADTWLLFLGPDKVGKKKMAVALSELLFGTVPTIVSFSDYGSREDSEDGESNMRFRRKTALDRIVEAVRRNPFSVFVLEDIDQADMLVRGSIKQAIERGRLPDSNGREVSLGSAICIMTANSLPENARNLSVDALIQSEEKLESIAKCGWQLELLIGEKTGKRQADWLCKEVDRTIKQRREPEAVGLSLDLNLATGVAEEETGEGSRNSSDLTVEHEHDHGSLAIKQQSSVLPIEMIDIVDGAIMFKPVDFAPLRGKVSDAVVGKFKTVVNGGQCLQVKSEALDHIVAGIWFSGAAAAGFEEWTERVLVPSFWQLKHNQALTDRSTVRLISVKDECAPVNSRLPSRIVITVDKYALHEGHLAL